MKQDLDIRMLQEYFRYSDNPGRSAADPTRLRDMRRAMNVCLRRARLVVSMALGTEPACDLDMEGRILSRLDELLVAEEADEKTEEATPMSGDLFDRCTEAFYGCKPFEARGIREVIRVVQEDRDARWEAAVYKAGHFQTPGVFEDYIAECRNLLHPPKSWEERVTVERWIHDKSKWIVLCDGWNLGNYDGFKDKSDAERYRLGLIAEKKAEEAKTVAG